MCLHWLWLCEFLNADSQRLSEEAIHLGDLNFVAWGVAWHGDVNANELREMDMMHNDAWILRCIAIRCVCL